jgi:hypothetical protein
MELTKEHIQELKYQDIGAFLQENTANNTYIHTLLKNLGRLPAAFNGDWLVELLDNESSSIRFLAVKNLGKLKNDRFLKILTNIAMNDADTNVRREAVSAIGRLRKSNSKAILSDKLKDEDPKVVCQAIRGLLVFKGMEEVDEQLKQLIGHQNEMVRQIIRKEYFYSKEMNNTQKHTESYDYLKNVIVHGDAIETMKLLKDESVHLTFTSPPYYNYKNDLIFDTFGGSGTVERTAKVLGRYFFLTEKDKKYFSYMQSKLLFESDDEYPAKFMSFYDFKGTIV